MHSSEHVCEQRLRHAALLVVIDQPEMCLGVDQPHAVAICAAPAVVPHRTQARLVRRRASTSCHRCSTNQRELAPARTGRRGCSWHSQRELLEGERASALARCIAGVRSPILGGLLGQGAVEQRLRRQLLPGQRDDGRAVGCGLALAHVRAGARGRWLHCAPSWAARKSAFTNCKAKVITSLNPNQLFVARHAPCISPTSFIAESSVFASKWRRSLCSHPWRSCRSPPWSPGLPP